MKNLASKLKNKTKKQQQYSYSRGLFFIISMLFKLKQSVTLAESNRLCENQVRSKLFGYI